LVLWYQLLSLSAADVSPWLKGFTKTTCHDVFAYDAGKTFSCWAACLRFSHTPFLEKIFFVEWYCPKRK
jgi:hypothetical protein